VYRCDEERRHVQSKGRFELVTTKRDYLSKGGAMYFSKQPSIHLIFSQKSNSPMLDVSPSQLTREKKQPQNPLAKIQPKPSFFNRIPPLHLLHNYPRDAALEGKGKCSPAALAPSLYLKQIHVLNLPSFAHV
jgi:hypothetical protein